ncbi:tRNA-splicing endonuclease subunit Sen34 [Amia ocellicauda]|uniref:tRNA-splicing endonuclease subunit Sen34 n=1 Tax=Amia ocellicauda TaxID=2972642 RepID=UPI0034641F13
MEPSEDAASEQKAPLQGQPSGGGRRDAEVQREPGSEVDSASGPGTHCRPLRVCFSGATPLLWRSGDIRAARERRGIVGSMVGSLPRQPRQNSRLGRPAQLLPEEARLMAETGLAVLLAAPEPESEEGPRTELEMYRDRLQRNYEEQRRLALEDKKQVLERVMQEQLKDGSSVKADRSLRARLDSLQSSFSFPQSAMMVQLCTARACLSHSPEEHHWLAADWPHPRDERTEARYQVFRDLRQRGYYITSAGKFGGDYLVYPGDPLRFHAHFIAVCLPMESETPVSDFLALSRLGANVKKTVLLCSPDTDGQEVVYTSLQWSGMA